MFNSNILETYKINTSSDKLRILSYTAEQLHLILKQGRRRKKIRKYKLTVVILPNNSKK